MVGRKLPGLLMMACAAMGSPHAMAALADEIQVYTDDITEPGGFGVELHAITFPKGRKTPEYDGEVVTHHALFVTAELSWGLTRTVDVGLYLPAARDNVTGNVYAAGAKGRIKWLPIRGDAETGGWFAGMNLEIGRVAHRFSEVRSNAELRLMGGWRDENWLFAANPVIGKELSDHPAGRCDYGFGVKASRRVSPSTALGFEYYTERGPIGRPLPGSQQDNKLFAVIDYEGQGWGVSIGAGRGLSQAAERTTLKAIFELPF